MTDTVDQATRSRMMASVGRVDTGPEMVVRRALHRRGFRYRISDRGLPGSPDLKLTRYRAVVFVNGCFWHRHDGCRYATLPSSNREWWAEKFAGNVSRDTEKTRQLLKAGWRVMVVWECALRGIGSERDRVIQQLAGWIRSGLSTGTIPRSPRASLSVTMAAGRDAAASGGLADSACGCP